MPNSSSDVRRAISAATRSGTTSISAPKQPASSSRRTWRKTSIAPSAVLPTARNPPVHVALEGISPTWLTTGMPSSASARIVPSEAAQ